jgi:hypothetical protein
LDVNRVSIRELERKARVTQGLFRKPLGGDMRLSYRHVLQMVDAVGLPWTQWPSRLPSRRSPEQFPEMSPLPERAASCGSSRAGARRHGLLRNLTASIPEKSRDFVSKSPDTVTKARDFARNEQTF